jgi:hypothetical protein
MPNVLQPSLSNTPTSKQEDTITGIAPYTEDLLKRGQAFSTAKTPVYTGKLTSGPAQYESEAWKGLANLALPENSKFNTTAAQQYMNPYIEASLNPQLELQRRQAIINLEPEMTRLTKAGGFGGSRQAVLQGLAQENLLRQQAATTGAEYEKAYNAAMAQFNADQGNQRSNLTALSTAGGTQHDREQAALDAQYNEWLRQTKYPKEQLEEQKGLISALAPTLPKTQVLYKQKESALQQLTAGTAGLTKFAKDLGYASVTDLAKGMGVPVAKLASVFGITGMVNEAEKKISDPTYGKVGESEKPVETDTPEGTHRDASGTLIDDATGLPVGHEPPETPDFLTKPDIIMIDPIETEGYDYNNDHAKGGLIDLLHKMRGHK